MKNEDDQPVILTHIDSNSNNDLNNGSLTSPVSLAEPFAANLNVVSQVDVPPNGGYGWVCTACVFLINAHTWGVNSVSNIHVQIEQT